MCMCLVRMCVCVWICVCVCVYVCVFKQQMKIVNLNISEGNFSQLHVIV